MKGWKSVLLGLGVAVVSPAVNYIAGIDWTTLGLSPTAGGVIGAAIIGVRALTNSPIFKAG